MNPLADVQLHSSLPNQADEWNRAIGPAEMTLRCDGDSRKTILSDHTGILRQWDDPLAALKWMADFEGIDSATSRWIGFLSYDLGRLFEVIPVRAADDLYLPLFIFTLHDSCRVGLAPPFPHPAVGQAPPYMDSDDPADYLRKTQRVIDYISAGDVFQVNLSRRISVPARLPPIQIWNNLRRNSPAAYGAFLDYGDFALIGNSPELFLHLRRNENSDRIIKTRPIKGTRPRAPGMETQLRDSPKDQAELNMIIDLERNDLGRVCRIGSVKVTEPRTIESHPTVYHGVATVEGILRDDISFIDLLRATFPGGSITGAPKIRAMQIIEELEPVRRGPYCGAIGYISADGSMMFNIAIRTMIVKNGIAHISVGGGIVADSNPAEEFEETRVKAMAMLRALEVD